VIVSTAAFLGYGTGTDLGYLTGDVIQKTITEQKKGPTKNLNTHGHGFENSVLSDTNLKQKIGYGSVQQSANQKTKQKRYRKRYRTESRIANTYSSHPDPDPALSKVLDLNPAPKSKASE
jgi:hypothetical protein